jgi:hypothetical protein
MSTESAAAQNRFAMVEHGDRVRCLVRVARAQTSVSAMETADDNLLSTVRSVVESMGGST